MCGCEVRTGCCASNLRGSVSLSSLVSILPTETLLLEVEGLAVEIIVLSFEFNWMVGCFFKIWFFKVTVNKYFNIYRFEVLYPATNITFS